MKSFWIYSIINSAFFLAFWGCQTDGGRLSLSQEPSLDSLSVKDGIYYGPDDNGIVVAFADFPEPYRNFFVPFCANCHSNRWTLQDDRGTANFNTWEQVKNYGALKLLLMAQDGTMPIEPGPGIPPGIIGPAIKLVSAGIDSGLSQGAIGGIIDPEILAIAQKYCGGCHGYLGTDLNTADLRDYQGWVERETDVLNSINGSLISPPMPERGTQEFELWAKNPVEKEKLIQWVQGGLENE